jgi:multidrug resistance efflux pump
VVSHVAIHQGQDVHKGDVLLELDATASHLALRAATAEQQQARAELAVLEQQRRAAAVRAERLAAAAKAGAGEGQLADDAAAALAQLTAQREVTQAAIAAAEVKASAARYEITQRTLRSPQSGTVVQLAAQDGVAVSAQSGALVTLLPAVPRIVRAELSEGYVAQVRAGLSAEVSAEDDAEKAWPARVLRVSAVVAASQLEDDPQRRASSRTVECVLSLDPMADLRVGQRVMVRFLKPVAATKD